MVGWPQGFKFRANAPYTRDAVLKAYPNLENDIRAMYGTMADGSPMPEVEIQKSQNVVKNAKPRILRTLKRTEGTPPKPVLSNWQRAELLNNFHKEHGNFEDVEEYVQNEEQNENTLWQQVNRPKNRLTSEEDYHQRMEQRIEDLMAKIDAGEMTLEDLTPEDRQVIIEINKQNEV